MIKAQRYKIFFNLVQYDEKKYPQQMRINVMEKFLNLRQQPSRLMAQRYKYIF